MVHSFYDLSLLWVDLEEEVEGSVGAKAHQETGNNLNYNLGPSPIQFIQNLMFQHISEQITTY